MRTLVMAAMAALTLAGCATGGGESDAPRGQPSLEIATGHPAPAQARFYGACIAQANANTAYDRIENTVRFTCAGEPAQAFFDGLAAYSAAEHSEYVSGIRTWRFTQRLHNNTAGVDYCWRDQPNANAEPAYSCTVVLNVGDFLSN